MTTSTIRLFCMMTDKQSTNVFNAHHFILLNDIFWLMKVTEEDKSLIFLDPLSPLVIST